MGVDGLLKWYQPYIKDCHIDMMAKSRVAVDGRSWFRKAAFGLGYAVVVEKNLHLVVVRLGAWLHELVRREVRIILVLEGEGIPLKQSSLQRKRQKKKIAQEEANTALLANDKKLANKLFSESIEFDHNLNMAIAEQLKIQYPSIEGSIS